jgi:hypothetical protein
LGIGYLVALDVLRDHGEPDNDTLTEVIRQLFRVETPLGRARVATAILVGGIGLYVHICKPEMRALLTIPTTQET